MKKRICCDCGKEFYGASNAKRCPACREIESTGACRRLRWMT